MSERNKARTRGRDTGLKWVVAGWEGVWVGSHVPRCRKGRRESACVCDYETERECECVCMRSRERKRERECVSEFGN